MRVAIVNESYWKNTGIPTHIRSYVDELVKHGVNITVIATDVDQSQNSSVLIFSKVIKSHHLLLKIYFFYKKVSESHAERGIDILHVHDSIAFLPTWLFSKIHQIPVMFTCHGTVYQKDCGADYKPLLRVLYKITDKLYAILSDRLIAISNEIRSVLVSMGARQEKIDLIPGIIGREFASAAEPPRPFPTGEIKCLFVGALRPTKGCEYLIHAIPDVLKRVPHVKFEIVGPYGQKGYVSKILSTIKDLNIEEVIQIRGYVPRDELQNFYRSADIFILPSVNEPQGLVILEAMSSGLPVVASNVGGIPDMIAHAENGLLVEAANPYEISEAIVRLCTDRGLYCKVSEAAIQYIRNFPAENHVCELIETYRRLL